MLIVLLFLFAATGSRFTTDIRESPVSADSIVDTVGVNIHLHSGNTIYGNFRLVQSLLAALGVRHTRDGLIDSSWKEYYQRHIELGRMGIRCLFITSPAQSSALLTSWPERVPGSFEGYEAPNEFDLSGDPNWVATLQAFVPRLYEAVKSDNATAKFPVVGPSLAQAASYAQLAGLQKYFDFDNMHNYFAGRNPGTPGWGAGGYGSILYNIKLDQAAWPGKPLVTTETGYITDTSIPQGIPELVSGKYVPRVILEQALHGVKRTYLYELIDEGRAVAGNDGAFGLARMDGSRKPAFVALQNLIATLSDPGPPFSPHDLQLSIGGGSGNVHHLTMAKRDGSYYIAFWLEEQGYDVNKSVETPVDPEKLTFTFGRAFQSTQLLVFGADGSLQTTQLASERQFPLTATDCIAILRLH